MRSSKADLKLKLHAMKLNVACACCYVEAEFGSAKWLNPDSRKEAIKGELMPTGKVKWFHEQKGYGFITPDDGGKDVFVHISALERTGLATLTDGQKVSFDLVTERGKTSARNLKLLR